MAWRMVPLPRPRQRRRLAIGLMLTAALAAALGALHWAFATMLEPANLLEMVRMLSLC